MKQAVFTRREDAENNEGSESSEPSRTFIVVCGGLSEWLMVSDL